MIATNNTPRERLQRPMSRFLVAALRWKWRIVVENNCWPQQFSRWKVAWKAHCNWGCCLRGWVELETKENWLNCRQWIVFLDCVESSVNWGLFSGDNNVLITLPSILMSVATRKLIGTGQYTYCKLICDRHTDTSFNERKWPLKSQLDVFSNWTGDRLWKCRRSSSSRSSQLQGEHIKVVMGWVISTLWSLLGHHAIEFEVHRCRVISLEEEEEGVYPFAAFTTTWSVAGGHQRMSRC